jgi:catechol 2,3-dioxygenase-like lactoylglutathione lyase family enzyme
MTATRTRFEGADPILCVRDMAAAVRYYVEVLGFENAKWGDETFTSVNRDRAGIYLCVGEYQGRGGAWVFVVMPHEIIPGGSSFTSRTWTETFCEWAQSQDRTARTMSGWPKVAEFSYSLSACLR